MIVLGCKYLCICYFNNCVIGVVMQQDKLCEEFFIGVFEMVMNFFCFVVQEICEWMVCFGVWIMVELVGCIDLFEMFEGIIDKQKNLDLLFILFSSYVFDDKL